MSDERTQRLAAAVANLRAAGESIPEDARDWTRAPGPYEGITRQMVTDLDADLRQVRDQSTWLLRLIAGVVITALILQVIR